VQGIQSLNRAILEAGRNGGEDVEGMGSTLAAVLVRDTPDGPLAIGAHVGDSRIYFLRGRQLFCLTKDHTIIERLVDSGALTPEQAIDHPQAGVLTRALGRSETLTIDLTSWRLLKPGDTFLLCSDGLSAYAANDLIRDALLDEEAPDVIARRLVDLALREHSQDNISILMFRVATGVPRP
jgi:protein phosphatase